MGNSRCKTMLTEAAYEGQHIPGRFIDFLRACRKGICNVRSGEMDNRCCNTRHVEAAYDGDGMVEYGGGE